MQTVLQFTSVQFCLDEMCKEYKKKQAHVHQLRNRKQIKTEDLPEHLIEEVMHGNLFMSKIYCQWKRKTRICTIITWILFKTLTVKL